MEALAGGGEATARQQRPQQGADQGDVSQPVQARQYTAALWILAWR